MYYSIRKDIREALDNDSKLVAYLTQKNATKQQIIEIMDDFF